MDDSKEELRGVEVEPCLPEDCIEVEPLIEDDCPEGTVLVAGAECVNSEEGVCELEFYEECVPVDEEPPPPPPEPDPEPEPEPEPDPEPDPDPDPDYEPPCAPNLGIRHQ